MTFDPMDIIGKRFGMLTVAEYIGSVDNFHSYRCICDCGNEKVTRRTYLRAGSTTSCGCYQRTICWRNRSTHMETIRDSEGKFNSPEYRAWGSAKERCSNPNHPAYHNYGGRGLTVCEEWANDFKAFLADVGRRPSKDHSLERINNDIGYFPDNVIWATKVDQNSNKRTNILIEFMGETKTLTQWAHTQGLSKGAVHFRLKSGWEIERALTTPARTVRQHNVRGPVFGEAECEDVRSLCAAGMSRSEIARRFGVTTTTVSKVVDKLGAYKC